MTPRTRNRLLEEVTNTGFALAFALLWPLPCVSLVLHAGWCPTEAQCKQAAALCGTPCYMYSEADMAGNAAAMLQLPAPFGLTVRGPHQQLIRAQRHHSVYTYAMLPVVVCASLPLLRAGHRLELGYYPPHLPHTTNHASVHTVCLWSLFAC